MITLQQILLALGTIVFFVILSYILIYALRKLAKLTKRTQSTLDDFIIKEIKKPVKFIIILTGMCIGIYYIIPDLKINGFSIITLYKILAIIAFTYFFIKLLTATINWYFENKAKENKIKLDTTLVQFLRKTIIATVIVMALLMILDTVGIKVGPILAGLGIAGLAVALALQDTLGNFFASIYLTVDRPVKIGDYIELDTKHMGYVKEIGWRSTKLKTRENNVIIIPNSKLSQSIVINYHQPFTSLKVQVPIGVSYNSDLEKVEKVIIETANKLRKGLEEADKNTEPSVRFENFGDSSINLTVNIYAKDYESQFTLKDKCIREIHKAFMKNKIEIPYPQRVMHRV